MSVAKVLIRVMAPKTYELPYHHIDVVKEFSRLGNNVAGIKFLRAEYDLSLLEAKNLYDTIRDQS